MQTDASEERLSKYELLRPLGSGGMGEVFLARDTVLRRQVAIKFVSPARLSDPLANARLLREARAAATLDHPGICPVYDVHVAADGRTCIVMQYVEGETLARRLTRGHLSAREALSLAAGIADALAAAHRQGIVHRDLKPQNVMLTRDGRAKLLDFGIAQTILPAAAIAGLDTHTDTGLSPMAGVIGTPAYMSPEQVLQKPLDGRSDLFSLGAVLFECLTGTPAFLARTDLDTWARVAYYAPPPASALDPRVPAAVDRAVERLLAKGPDDRYGSAGEAAAALRRLSRRLSGRARAWTAAAVVIAAALGGVAAWRMTRPRGLPPPPPGAQEYYERGVQYLRDGAYARAEKVLAAAVEIYPPFPQALARLAEARNELDEETSAEAALVRIGDLTRAGLVLPDEEALRVDAISALVQHDLARAAAGYRRLAEAHSGDRGGWLDLARVLQEAGLRDAAREACARALGISPTYAAAHLRMGALHSVAVRRDDALREFAEAERLYALDSLTEGQAEALLQRGAFLDAIGDFAAAQAALDAGARLLAVNESPYQQVRAAMLRSSLVESTTGDFEQALRLAQDGVEIARQARLGPVAANALAGVGLTLMLLHDPESPAVLQRAIALARSEGARRVEARATLQLASAYLERSQTADARTLAEGTLDYVRRTHDTRYELIALSIIERAQEDTDPLKAADAASQLLSVARSVHDDVEVTVALEGLAGARARLGSLPEALDLREQEERLRRGQRDTANLPYDLTNRAELLIRLGRFDEAETALREVDEGAAKGVRSYLSRARRVAILRALSASERRQPAEAIDHAQAILGRTRPDPGDPTFLLAEAFSLAARAPRGRGARPLLIDPSLQTPSQELRYWRIQALLAAGDSAGAAAEADAGLATLAKAPSDEFEWRVAALASAAAAQRGDTARAGTMKHRAQASLDRLRGAWKDAAAAYERRPDLVECKRRIGVS